MRLVLWQLSGSGRLEQSEHPGAGGPASGGPSFPGCCGGEDRSINYKAIQLVIFSYLTGHYMFAHYSPDVNIFSITSPEETKESCLEFIFNVHVMCQNNELKSIV